MAEIKGFRAIRYNLDELDEPADVLAPPYDVIDADEQAELYEKHPANVIRLVLNRQHDSDTAENSRYTRARRHLMDWLARGLLRQDNQPGLYAHHQTFTDAHGNEHTRKGFLGAVRLATYDEEVVLPHERTLRGPKVDRLELMKACDANMSPIFFLYDDPERKVDALLEANLEESQELDVTTDHDGIRHRTWPVFDADAQAEIARVLEDSQLLIADGHHRYETALAYRDFRREVAEESVENAPYEYVMAFMVNIHDPGLQVFGTHRVVHGVEDFDMGELLSALEDSEVFKVRRLSKEHVDEPLHLNDQLTEAGESAPSFMLLSQEAEGPILVQYTGDESADIFDEETPDQVRRLDVAILHEGIIDRMLGINKEAQEAKTNLRYIKKLDGAVAARKDDDVQLVVLMNPTPVEQVVEVCQSGGKMPQKSTFFYPKILSGLTINPL
ncbi:DUF1015 domain-containing protein [Persicimonas caeni]|uniref:DUF1015 domain-containing protein n=1 Tax=Persicimonas caeni TaxID=2292766 RepID=A0A4Y6PUP4_PERCE|nr:DUF1015 domain-containing protein [Persicimonas caeni]QDG51727.1 DUF1015 domain-containing protein [Persicimonas caeni]QED32948.1 DUF1015 domain-containing protein [Persicimonas caeni]